MKTKHFKTLKGLLAASYNGQFTFSDYLAKRLFCKDRKLYNVVLDDKVETQLLQLFAGVVYAKATTERMTKMARVYCDCGLFSRLWIKKSKYDGQVRADYCAGQDYVSEIRMFQYLIRKYGV